MSTRSKATAQTRERLLDAALTLFSQRGYAATGIRDILQTAGVTQPTLYHHFADKASLLQTLIERHYGESQQQLERSLQVKHLLRVSYLPSSHHRSSTAQLIRVYHG